MSHPRGGEPRPPNGVLPQLGYFVAAALLYVVLARIGLKLTIPPHDIAVFWPPNGVLLAMLLASDRRRWPAIFGGLITGHYLLRLLVDRPQVIDTVYLTANLAELWIGASLIRRFCGEALTFRSMREVLALLGGSIVLGCGVSATMAAAVTVYHFKDLSFLSVWRSWWVADAMSVLLITPMLVTLSPHSRALGAPSSVGSRLEGLVLFVLLAVVSELVFGLEHTHTERRVVEAGQIERSDAVALPVELGVALPRQGGGGLGLEGSGQHPVVLGQQHLQARDATHRLGEVLRRGDRQPHLAGRSPVRVEDPRDRRGDRLAAARLDGLPVGELQPDADSAATPGERL